MSNPGVSTDVASAATIAGGSIAVLLRFGAEAATHETKQ